MEPNMNVAGLTDTGRIRNQNQDAFFASTQPIGAVPNLFIMADGMGGHKAGDVASTKSVERFCHHVAGAAVAPGNYINALLAAAHKVNLEIYEMAQGNPDEMSGMGTTFIACVIEGGRADFIHVGDSRAYFISPKGIEQCTLDHTYAEEMFRAGEISAEEARTHPRRHHLTRVLGYSPEVDFDGFSRPLEGVSSPTRRPQGPRPNPDRRSQQKRRQG
jgi:protein phosphatase